MAFTLGTIEALRNRLRLKGVNIERKNVDGQTPLIHACNHGKLDHVRLLLEHGANPDGKDAHGNTPLCVACNGEDDDCVEILLRHGANPDISSKNGETPLHLACQDKLDEIIRLLLEYGADSNPRNKDDETPMHNLLRHPLRADEDIELDSSECLIRSLQFLLDADADPTAKDSRGNTFLHLVGMQDESNPRLAETLQECQTMIKEHMSISKKRTRLEVSEDDEPSAKRGRIV